MSLDAFFQDRHTPAKPVRPTIRRRLLGRGHRLRTLGMAAGLLSLGLTISQPAHAATKNWDGSAADWYSSANHWMPSGFPQPGDDARNTFTNAAMTLGADASVNSFISNSAFTLNGGTFSGSTGVAGPDTPNLHTLQVNNIFTLNGGTINNFTIAAGSQQAGGPVPSVVVTNSGGNDLVNSVVNANLDLATNADAFLRIQGTDTVNGTITLATTSNGLQIYTNGDNLILGGSGKLIGFGNISEVGGNSILTNNGTVNANVSGKTLAQVNTNFVNNGTAEATGGGTLALNNTLTNSGKLIADGTGSVVSLVGTLNSITGNTISALNGGQVRVNGVALGGTINGVGATSLIFNGNGNNGFNNTTANINLDLATNADAFLRFQGTDTVNGNISLATTSNGLQIYTNGDNLVLSSSGSLVGFGNISEVGGGSILTNNGLINANVSGKTLAQVNTNFVNNGTAEATGGGTLALNNTLTNSGKLIADGTGSVVSLVGTLNSITGNTISALNGGQVRVNGVALGGTINGVGATSLIFNGNGNNGFNNTTANINLDLATNADAFLRFQGTDTVNGNISLATTSNGLDIYTTGDNLVLSSSGSLVGFGSVYEQGGGSILTNNGLINANVSGKTLAQVNTNFVNNGTAKATNGATLALNNIITNNGVLGASGGGILTITGTLNSAAGNTINGVGGQVRVNGVALGGTINGVGATSLIFNGNGNNGFNNTTANINLDLATNADAFLRFQGTDTVNGNISLATTSNGLDIYTTGDNLVLGGSGKLIGFGNVYEQGGGSILTNNGLINANVSGKTLAQVNTNFVNNNLAEATNGGILSLNNNISNSAGATIAATGTGSVVSLVGTFTGTGNNLLTASGGGQIQGNGVSLRGTINTDASTALILNSSGNNDLDNTVVNGNLDLASNAGFLRVYDTGTVNGKITLATTSSGLDIYTSGANLVLGSTGSLVGAGLVYEQGGGATLTNGGLVNANISGKTLNITNTNFTNTGTANASNGGNLNVTSGNATNSGTVAVQPGSTATFSNGLTQTAGATSVFGTLNASEAVQGGVFEGFGTANGNVTNTGGKVQATGPVGLLINGNFSQSIGGELDAFFGNNFHDVLTVTGQTTTGGNLGVFDLDPSVAAGFAAQGSKFDFLDYSGTLTPDGSTVNGFTQYFTNEIPDSNTSGKIMGQFGFVYELTNDTTNHMLDLTVVTAGSPVPEASTTVSFGLLLALGLGGLVVASKRKKKA